MSRIVRGRERQRGQVLPIFAAASLGLLLIVGVVVDFGYYFVQGRSAQNTADMAALAGTRIVAAALAGDPSGTDANVVTAIDAAVAANNAAPVVYGAANSPQYVDFSGKKLGYVGDGIPRDAKDKVLAYGVVVETTKQWKPFFIGLAGINAVSLTKPATARAAFATADTPGTLPTSLQEEFPPGGNLIPYAISLETWKTFKPCDKPNPADCDGGIIRFNKEGEWNMPGGFGWLKFCPSPPGIDPSACDNYSGPNPNSKPFLQIELGHPGGADLPISNSFGCCGDLTGKTLQIESIPGNKASADLSWYIANKITVWVPIFDKVGSQGSNGWYRIVGFAGMQITDSKGAKDTYGVLRDPIIRLFAGSGGPGSSSYSSTPGTNGYTQVTQAINIQLLR